MVNLARRVRENIEKREEKAREVSQKVEEGSVLGLGVGFIKKKEKRKEAKEGPTVSKTGIKKKK